MEGSELAWHDPEPYMCVRPKPGKMDRSAQGWAGSSPTFGSTNSKQRGRVGAGELPEKPGLLLLSNSAQDSRTWELGCCRGSFIYLGDL